MIHPDYIIQLQTVCDAPLPPGISGLLMVIPVIERIPPQLSVRRERVRRTSRHRSGSVVFVKLKQLMISPGVRAVRRHIDGYIPYDLHASGMRVFLQLLPLLHELILHEPKEAALLSRALFHFLQSLRITHPKRIRPPGPADAAKGILDPHKQHIIVQPECILPGESPIVFFLFKMRSAARFFQQCETVLIQFQVINMARVRLTEVNVLDLCLLQQPLRDQCVQIKIVRIPRKRGKRLIWGIPVAGRSQREDLPVGLPRPLQKIDKVSRAL